MIFEKHARSSTATEPGPSGRPEWPDTTWINEDRLVANRWRKISEKAVRFTIEPSGRVGWVRTAFQEACARGVTTTELPSGLRWAAYVSKLRRLGRRIMTQREAKGGPLVEHYTRYALRCRTERAGVQ